MTSTASPELGDLALRSPAPLHLHALTCMHHSHFPPAWLQHPRSRYQVFSLWASDHISPHVGYPNHGHILSQNYISQTPWYNGDQNGELQTAAASGSKTLPSQPLSLSPPLLLSTTGCFTYRGLGTSALTNGISADTGCVLPWWSAPLTPHQEQTQRC